MGLGNTQLGPSYLDISFMHLKKESAPHTGGRSLDLRCK